MTAKSLVLHIGDPKTGTSSIQEVLRSRLYETAVHVDYTEQLNSFPLANALWDPKKADTRAPRYTRLAAWLAASDADMAVVSAEQFFRVDPTVLHATLNEFLPDYAQTIRVIAYVRPHASRLLSAYMQRTKAGLFNGDLATFFDRTKREDLLIYAPRFQTWRDTFGPRFTLRPMIREHLRDGDVVTDFLDYALNGAPFTLSGPVQANASLPLECLIGLREVQGVLTRNAVATATQHSVGDHISRTLSRLIGSTGTRLHLPQDLYQAVKDYCVADAAALDAAFFDLPLMTRALQEAGQDTVPNAPDMQAAQCFSPAALTALRQNARKLAANFERRPLAWTLANDRETGLRSLGAGKIPQARTAEHIETVDRILTEIAETIATATADMKCAQRK